jgi:hypothetical protein
MPVVTEGWSARPLAVGASFLISTMNLIPSRQIHTMQTNGVDCGLWVLAAIAAVLRGYQVTALCEGDMVAFRELLYNYISLSPITM